MLTSHSPWEGHEAATSNYELPKMRLAQMAANNLPLTAMATAVDLGPHANVRVATLFEIQVLGRAPDQYYSRSTIPLYYLPSKTTPQCFLSGAIVGIF